jgi:hypothetical protein
MLFRGRNGRKGICTRGSSAELGIAQRPWAQAGEAEGNSKKIRAEQKNRNTQEKMASFSRPH